MYLKEQLSGFVPQEAASEIIKNVVRGSSVLRLSKVEPMNSDRKKFNVLVDGAGAYWVGEGERISTSGATWIHPEIQAKKLAVIIPVTKEKLADSTVQVFSELMPDITEAFHKAIDKACIFGENSPFTTSIMGSVGKTKMLVKNNSDIDLAMSDTMALVEGAGYEVTGFAGHIGIKNTLRKLRDSNGAPIYIDGTNQKENYSQPIEFVRSGAWDKSKADLIGGEWKYSIVGIRSGIEFEVLTEATLQGTLDTDGKPISLAEQDMIAIKATMRIGYLVIKDDAFAALKIAEKALGELAVTLENGSAAGKYKVNVSPALLGNGKLMYKIDSSAQTVTLGGALTNWTELSGEVSMTSGQVITVAEAGTDGKALKVGSATA